MLLSGESSGGAQPAQRGFSAPTQRADPPDPGQPPVEEANARPTLEAATPPPPAPVRVNTPISVRTNSWVELRGPNGDVLTQTYVRAGESYVVPAGIAYRITEAR